MHTHLIEISAVLWGLSFVDLMLSQLLPFVGESPSSASDVDNLNNLVTADKVLSAKCVNSTPVTPNHVIPAQNRQNFVRLLNFVSAYKHLCS